MDLIILGDVISVSAITFLLWWLLVIKRKSTLRFLKKYTPSGEEDLVAIKDIQDGNFGKAVETVKNKIYRPTVAGIILVITILGMGLICFGVFIIVELLTYDPLVHSSTQGDMLAAFFTAISVLILGWFNFNAGVVLKFDEENLYTNSFWSYLYRKQFKTHIIFKQVKMVQLIPHVARAGVMSHSFTVVITTDKKVKINLFLFSPVQIKEIVSFLKNNNILKDKVTTEKPSYF